MCPWGSGGTEGVYVHRDSRQVGPSLDLHMEYLESTLMEWRFLFVSQWGALKRFTLMMMTA